jgi:hypothetical protein
MAYYLIIKNLQKFISMKTPGLKYMVYLLLLAGVMMSSFDGYSQAVKLTKQEKKELKRLAMETNFRILDSLLNSKKYVLVADFLRGKYGDKIPVVQTLNFIKVNVTTGILQTGSNSGMGSNSVGGVTAEGSLGGMKIVKNEKNLRYDVRFGINTQLGHYDVYMTVSWSNNASATITGLSNGSLTWEGHLETIENSRIFKGQNSF